MFVRIGMVLSVVAVGLAVLGFSGIVVARRGGAPKGTTTMSDAAVLRAIARELTSVGRDRASAGWTPVLIGRALAALRVVAAYAVGRPVAQRRVEWEAAAHEGAVPISRGPLSRPQLVVSSPVTSHAVARALMQTPPLRAADAGRLAALGTALETFTRARYGAGNAGPDQPLDDGLAAAERIVGQLAFETGAFGWTLKTLASRAPQLMHPTPRIGPSQFERNFSVML